MALRRLAPAALCAAAAAAAPDPTCSTGTLGDGGKACCAKSCGGCGGTDCGHRPGGQNACCCGDLEKTQPSCAVSGPPCVMDVTPDPTCATGILNSDGVACCAKSCGTCGGSNCQNLPGGSAACCAGGIEGAGRPCAAYAPPCALPLPPPPPPGPPRGEVRPKRGFVGDGCKGCPDAALLNVSGWYYDYNVDDNYHAAAPPNEAGRFTPMHWCFHSGALDTPVPGYVNTTFMMGFNEPNNVHNCNENAESVAKVWKTVMDKWPDSVLVSPATSGNGIAWYDEFFGNCTALYGKGGCRISHLATHTYSCNAKNTLSYLKELYDRYGYPVWLTEFSCGEGARANPTAMHIKYMQEVVPLLDAAPYVYRYAWMSARDGRGLRGLVEDDKLTALGELWNSL